MRRDKISLKNLGGKLAKNEFEYVN